VVVPGFLSRSGRWDASYPVQLAYNKGEPPNVGGRRGSGGSTSVQDVVMRAPELFEEE
jgi:hypothetical protein